MQKIDVKPLILKALYFFAGAIVCLQTFHLGRYVSFCFYATFFLTLIYWTVCALRKIEMVELLVLLAICIAFINVLANATLSNTAVGIQYVKKVLSFSSTLLFFAFAYKTEPDESTCRWIYRVLDMVSMFLIFSYFYQGQRAYLFNDTVTKYLTLGFTNPNLTGLFLSGIIMLELNRLPSLVRIWQRLLVTCEVVFLLYFLWKTQARNALLAVAIFLALFCVLSLRKVDSIRPSKAFAWLMSFWPLLFATVYLLLIQMPTIMKLFSFMESSGKSVSSRAEIWSRAIDLWIASPILGAYSQGSGGTGNSQFHNTHIDILVSYGPVVLFIVCFVLFSLIYMGGKRQQKWQFLLTLGFVCELFLGVGEAAIFAGGLAVHLYAGTFLLLRNRVSSISVMKEKQ